MTQGELPRFHRRLSGLVQLGHPLAEALRRAGMDFESPATREAVERAAAAAAAGEPLEAALARAPDVFPPLYRKLAAAGAQSGSGGLEKLLDQLAGRSREAASLRARVAGSVTYPAIAVAGALAVLGLQARFLYPDLVDYAAELGRAEVGPLAFASALAGPAVSWVLFLAAFALAGATVWLVATGRADRMPLFRAARRAADAAWVARAWAALLRAGETLPDALQAAADASEEPSHSESLRDLSERVEKGADLTDGGDLEALFGTSAARALGAAAQAGDLADAADAVGDLLALEAEVSAPAAARAAWAAALGIAGVAVAAAGLALFAPYAALVGGP